MHRLTLLTSSLSVVFACFAAQAMACTVPSNADTLASEVAQGLNAHRAANGLSQLEFNRRLARAAMDHACDMSDNGFFGHTGSDGSDISKRVKAAGYRFCSVAENLAWGYPRAEQIVSGWMDSPGHRANMLKRRVEEFGIAVTDGEKGPNWVLVVGRQC